jgi:lipopolysaccharide/colanic/teichoic acid biosynthesis glycosyltransferase
MRAAHTLHNAPTRHTRWYERLLLSPVVGHTLALLLVVGGSHFLAYGTLDPGGDANRTNTMMLVGVAYVLSCILGGQLNRFPGSRSPAYLLAVTGSVYALVFSLVLLTRIEYARGILFTGLILTLVLQFVGFYINKRFRQLKLAVAPLGRVNELPQPAGVRWQLLGEPDLHQRRYDGLVVDLDSELPSDWARFIAHVSVARIPVFNLTQVLESATGRMQLDRLTVNDMGSLQPTPFYEEFRRLAELVLVLVLAPVWIPLTGILALCIKLDSPGPVFFVQERVGRGNRIFRMMKFRSMCERDADEPAAFADSDAHRITRLGALIRRMRLDEIPQFINVLKGDMSLIGPRPEQPDFVRQFEEEVPFYTYRHMVRPGITGWAQVQQGYAADTASTRTKVEYDFYYIQHLSLWLDLLILLKTIRTIVTGFGAR